MKLKHVLIAIVSLGLLGTLLIPAPAAVLAADNLAANGDLELGTTNGWEISSAAIDSSVVHGGSYSLKLTATSAYTGAVYKTVPVRKNATVTVSFYYRYAASPNGTYHVMLAVVLGGNCDPDAPQNSYRYEDFFRLVVDRADKNDTITPTVQLHPLYEKYPQYWDLDGMKGVEVYVWQMGGNGYYCGALSGTNRLKTEEEIQALFANGATIEEMRTILELCEVEREKVSIIPVRNPLSSFWYEIDVEYAAQINALFWGE